MVKKSAKLRQSTAQERHAGVRKEKQSNPFELKLGFASFADINACPDTIIANLRCLAGKSREKSATASKRATSPSKYDKRLYFLT